MREVVVEVPAPPVAPGDYRACEVCLGRGLVGRYGTTPHGGHRLHLHADDGTAVRGLTV
ncbi:hypothetical protein [Kitasatospora sp. NPDC051914]|uniref:hypothetical protein n=1 Tax=Kitasatospora sp. NPDC051914 TaxID=3154945 RepID=UPI00342A2606